LTCTGKEGGWGVLHGRGGSKRENYSSVNGGESKPESGGGTKRVIALRLLKMERGRNLGRDHVGEEREPKDLRGRGRAFWFQMPLWAAVSRVAGEVRVITKDVVGGVSREVFVEPGAGENPETADWMGSRHHFLKSGEPKEHPRAGAARDGSREGML